MIQTGAAAKAREALRDITPLKGDCGRRCGAACCHADDDGKGGMLLYPGEEALYGEHTPWARLTQSGDIALGERPLWLLTCDGSCDRENRPLACRIFPLVPVAEGEGVAVRLDVRAWPVCPLMEHGMEGLQRRFVEAAQAAAELLWQDDACREVVLAQTNFLRKFTEL